MKKKAKKKAMKAARETESEPSIESAVPGIALALLQGWLENNAKGALEYGGSAAVVGARKLGMTFEQFSEHLQVFWEREDARES